MTDATIDMRGGRGLALSCPDALDAITVGGLEARRAGHDLGGFKRQSGHFGYRFAARCRSCGWTVVIVRHGRAWALDAPRQQCPPPRASSATTRLRSA